MNEQVTDIKEILKSLNAKVSSLQQTVSEQGTEISRLNRLDSLHQKEMHEAKLEIAARDKEISDLKERLSKYEKPELNSTNSSTPPTGESIKAKAIRRTKSLRKKSSKKSGGQPGHKGYTLMTNDEPDEIVGHSPCFCQHCGKSLEDIPAQKIRKTQVIDIEMPKVKTTEHHYFEKVCSCGHHNKVDAPNYRVSYGKNLRAMVVYLLHVQCLSMERVSETVSDFFHRKISQGTVSNIIKEIGKKSEFAYEEIRKRIEKSPVAGADETGAAVGKELHWNWIFQTDVLTYVYQMKSRGIKAIDAKFPDGLPNTALVTDRHGSYFKMKVKKHQVCLAHLLRNAEYLNELDEEQDWSKRFQKCLRDAIALRKSKIVTARKIKGLENKMSKLLTESLTHLHKDFETFKKGIYKVKDYLFTFLTDFSIPYDNNASERGVRKIKVKQKVCGCFRTDEGADIFAQIHSIVETAKKNGNSKYAAILAMI